MVSRLDIDSWLHGCMAGCMAEGSNLIARNTVFVSDHDW